MVLWTLGTSLSAVAAAILPRVPNGRVLSAKLGRFCPHYALNLFRKLVDLTRTIYNIPTTILFIDGNGNLLFRFYLLIPCRLLSWCRLPAICLLSACYLPIPRRLSAICLFVWFL